MTKQLYIYIYIYAILTFIKKIFWLYALIDLFSPLHRTARLNCKGGPLYLLYALQKKVLMPKNSWYLTEVEKQAQALFYEDKVSMSGIHQC